MRIRFIVNGLGLGNSTRCHSVIQQLVAKGCEVSVATSGNGLWYFDDKVEISQLDKLESLNYESKDGKINIFKTIVSTPRLVSTIRRNSRQLTEILKNERPDAVVIDSEYGILPMKRLKIPVVALNNSDVVVHSRRKYSPLPISIRAQFYAVEMLDYMFHKILPNIVISPSLDMDLPSTGTKFKRVAVIVRKQYRATLSTARSKKVVIMLSGSVFGSRVIIKKKSYNFQLDIIGRDAPEGWQDTPGIRYHSKLLDNLKLLQDADLVVVNGGFSAVSEAVSLKKPMVVIPVPHHAEQWINGRTVEELGIGLVAEEADLENKMIEAYGRIDEFRDAYEKISPHPVGAETAAQIILDFVAERSG